MANEPHQLARSVKRERAGASGKFYTGFLRSAVPFPVVALIAAGHQILPGRPSPARTRDDVVKSQFGGRKHAPAKLAGVAVSKQDILAGQGTSLLRNMTVGEQSDDRRHLHRSGSRMDNVVIQL